MECISADPIEEILVRLPVKSLLRFKRVCRRWRALIQSRSFIRRHYCHDSNQEHLLLQWGEYVQGRLEESDINPLWLDYCVKHRCHRIGPAFGLMLEVCFSGDIVLLNPATHKAKRVPPIPLIPRRSVSLLCFGLGVESSSGDYKIVVFDSRAADAFAWVYNSTSDCWKRIEGVFSWESEAVGWEMDARFLNGVYYWMFGDDGEVGCKVLAFDMMTEKFRVFESPRGVRPAAAYVESESIAVMSQQGGDKVVWVMGEQGIWSECWRYRNASGRLFELCVWKGEVFFWDLEDDNVVVVDVTTQKVRIHETRCSRQYPIYRRPLCCYKESLLSIKGEQDASSIGDDLAVE